MKKRHHPHYSAWNATPQGAVALRHIKRLLRGHIAGWQRRSRSLLVLNAGSGEYLEMLWQSGFDLTAHEDRLSFLKKCQTLMGHKIEYTLAAPEHLAFQDDHFDYTVAIGGLEFWADPQAVLAEIARVTRTGCVLVFPNLYSCFALEMRLKRKAQPFPAPLLSPRHVRTLATRAFGTENTAWAGTLLTPYASWTFRKLGWLHEITVPLPLGAFAALRLDFSPMRSCTPLLLRSTSTASAKSSFV